MINGELSVFLLTLFHLTSMLLMVSKQGWCYFEALECIFHLNLKNFPPSISCIIINKIQRFRTYGRPCRLTCSVNQATFMRVPHYGNFLLWNVRRMISDNLLQMIFFGPSVTQCETNHFKTQRASVLAWCYLAGRRAAQLVLDFFLNHQRFELCCAL